MSTLLDLSRKNTFLQQTVNRPDLDYGCSKVASPSREPGREGRQDVNHLPGTNQSVEVDMNKLTNMMRGFWQDEEGLTTVEYAVAGTLVALAVVTAFTDLGTAVGNSINDLVEVVGA